VSIPAVGVKAPFGPGLTRGAQALWSLIRLSPKLAITSSSPPSAST
jgi:hypothetical protein